VLATLRQRNFALLWFAGLISYAGDWALIAALPVYLFERTNSILFAGLIWIVYPLSGLLFGSVAGVFVDRWDRRRTMVGVNLLQSVLMPGMLLGIRADALWVLYAVAFVEGALVTFMYPAESALLPRLVGEERLVTANALNSLNDNLARIAGPAIGGLLLANAGFAGAVVVDAVSYFLAAVLIALIAVPGGTKSAIAEGGQMVDEPPSGLAGVWRELVDGLHFIRGDRTLRALLIIVAVSILADSLNSPIIAPFILQVALGGAALFGLVLATRGAAGLLGGVVIARLGQRLAPKRLLGWSLVLLGLGLLLFINIPVIPVMLGVQLALGPAVVGWLTSQQTLLQTAAEDRYRGRVFGAVGTMSSLMALFGIGLGSALGEVIGLVPTYNLSALLYAGAGVLALILFRPAVLARSAALQLEEVQPWEL
jgi:MFS family permease